MNKLELFANEHGIILLFAVLLIIIWTTMWKGFALWKSAQLRDKWWFIALLIVNTVGILEIFYIYYFSKKKDDSSQGIVSRDRH